MPNNRLSNATSPYLLQHADHPVNWQPWDDTALAQAKAEDKPILLSIGYSACHWCHVMAHESFEDRETADLMNQLFINIKVDREERPDLDRIYQTAHQLLAQRPGGWPLTVFLMPEDQNPFFAGTYFPKHPRHGLPPFKGLLQSIATAFHEQRSEISQQNLALQKALSQLEPGSASGNPQPDAAPLDIARQQLAQSFDETYGGFGQAPKFPHPTSLNRLLRHWATTALDGSPDPRALYAADFTLTRMARGGINDQLGGGFCRYSVDDQWMIPHFEKMLYDNGPLLTLYTDLWQATGKPLFAASAERTGDWVIREMQSSAGGYYSTLDADSEGAEGLFYLWTPEQVRPLLNEDEYRHFSRYYGLDRPANFEGSWHLHGCASIAELNQEFGSTAELAESLLASGRRKTFQARETRVRPARDEKILCSWNGLMIKGMARAGRHLGKPGFLLSAQQALAFLQQDMWRDGRLLATHKDGRSSLPAYLDDYAFLLDAVLELLQARWRRQDLSFAIELASVLLEHFLDQERGGFFFTADDHERLIHRPRPFSDDATPAGNGVAAFALARLGHLVGEQSFLDAAVGTLQAGWQQMSQYPQAHCSLLEALEEYLYPTETIVIRGSGDDLQQWLQRATRHYAPRRFSVAIPASEPDLPGLLGSRTATGRTLAYICAGTRCEASIDDFESFDQRLTTSETKPQRAAQSHFDGVTGSFRRPRE